MARGDLLGGFLVGTWAPKPGGGRGGSTGNGAAAAGEVQSDREGGTEMGSFSIPQPCHGWHCSGVSTTPQLLLGGTEMVSPESHSLVMGGISEVSPESHSLVLGGITEMSPPPHRFFCVALKWCPQNPTCFS